MKFWELDSVCREAPGLLREICCSDSRWSIWGAHLDDMDRIVNDRRRDILDAQVPDDLARAALGQLPRFLYLGGGHLRSRRHVGADRAMTLLEVYEAFGGGIIEEVQEYGSARLPSPTPEEP